MAGRDLNGNDRSLVPYSSRDNNEIVLRHNNALVVRDPKHKQLVLRRAPTSGALELADCPYCRRPLHEGGRHHGPAGISPANTEAGFVDPNYFRMLRDAPSPAPSVALRPPSPLHGDVGGLTSSPPPEAEFVSRVATRVAPPSSSQGISAAALSQDYFRRFFVEEGELGRGGKGVVLLVKHVLDGVFLGHFACKRVPVGDDHAWLEKVLVEVQLLQHLSHQNLVSYRHVWLENMQLTKFGPSVPCAFILQQYCNGGDLHRYVCRPSKPATTTAEQLKDQMRRRSKGRLDSPDNLHEPRRLSFDVIYSFFKDITSGLKYLHDNAYIHRDLKPSNCLLHDTGKGLRVLVSDFGEAQMESAARKSTGATGTISYCAPEVLRPQYPGGPLGEFTARSDIFSLGMILYFMCFGRLPYDNADNLDEENEDLERLKEEISTWAGFDDQTRERTDLPDKLYKFLRRLLSLDPVERPTAEEILWGISTGTGLSDGGVGPHNSTQGNAPTTASLVNTSRISPLNTPPPSSSRGGIGRRMMSSSSGSGTGTGPTRPTGPLTSSSSTSTITAAPNLNNLNNHADPSDLNQEDSTPLQQRRRRRRRSPTSDDTPSPSPSPSPKSHSKSEEDELSIVNETSPHHHLPPPPLLLTPPPPSSSSTSSTTNNNISTTDPAVAPPDPSSSTSISPETLIVRIFLFLLKINSITIPCTPMAANQWIFYPLLYLAALDFLLVIPRRMMADVPGGGLGLTMLRMMLSTGGLLTLHVFVLIMAWWRKGLCY